MKSTFRTSSTLSRVLGRHAAVAGLTAGITGALGCAATDEPDLADDVGADIAEEQAALDSKAGHANLDSKAEQTQMEARLAGALERKRAYLEEGVVPAVPQDLSLDPQDPRFEFMGYANEATADEMAAVRAKVSDPEEVSVSGAVHRTKPLEERQTAGYLLSSTGEIWRWKVTPELLEQVKASTRGGRSADSVAPLGEQLQKGAEWDGTGKAIIGSTDNRQVRSAHTGHNMSAHPWNAIGGLNPAGTGSTSPNAQCTATKIGERHILTAGHCVWTGGEGGSAMYRDWWPGQDGMTQYWEGGDPSPNAIRGIFWYWISPGWFENGSPSEDYAVLVLHDSQGVCNIGRLGYRVDGSLAGTNVWMFGYPAWTNVCENSDHPQNSCRNSLWGMEENITRTQIEYIFYKHDQQEGQSGAPVYDYNGGNRQLVGIVKGEYTSIENRGIKITSGVYDDIQAVISEYPSAYCSY